jgi:Immunity protein 39
MAHDRKLVIGGIALTPAKIPTKQNGAAANRVRDELEKEMIQSGYLENAPFGWVGLLVRYGLIDETEPHYETISQKHGDLPLAIEVDTHRLLNASEDEMAAVYRKAALIALVHAGEKYRLKVDRMKELLAQA